MRISREQARENHDRVVRAAADLFRAHGFDGVAVAEVMKAAGFTHGGFYNHFGSKDELEVEALGWAFRNMARERANARSVADLVTSYLSRASHKHVHKSCPAAALAGDVSRKAEPVRDAFAVGLDDMIASFAARLGEETDADADELRHRGVNLLARLIGALMLSRAVPDGHPLSREILSACIEGALAEAKAAR